MQTNKTAILPQPDTIALEYSRKLQEVIMKEIKHSGPISFARFMELALYSPGLGYYAAGSHKFGAQGDFVTSPEISSLFSLCLARQCQQILNQVGGDILEFGAGSGIMAATVLAELQRLQALPDKYYILEVSADLQERQKQLLNTKIPDLFHKVVWLDQLPTSFSGVCLANEVLDAFPVHRFKMVAGAMKEIFVDFQDNQFCYHLQEPLPLLQDYWSNSGISLADGYESECNLNIAGWVASLGTLMKQGAVILIDYGFPRAEYFHPDRSTGTFMCHYRHHAHWDPLILMGLQDMTAHVDFTAVVEAAVKSGFDLAGYTNQANFLLSCGMIDYLSEVDSSDQYLKLSHEVKVLTSPSEMGELFKVIALTKKVNTQLLGFSMRDYSERL